MTFSPFSQLARIYEDEFDYTEYVVATVGKSIALLYCIGRWVGLATSSQRF